VYSPTRNGVLPNKKWCTPQQEMVYSPTRNGVLPNKKWCTPQQVPQRIFPANIRFTGGANGVPCIVYVVFVSVVKQQKEDGVRMGSRRS
jgi:hypothetical protein